MNDGRTGAWFVELRERGDDDVQALLAHLETIAHELGDIEDVQTQLRKFLTQGNTVTNVRSFAKDPLALDLFGHLANASRFGTGLAVFNQAMFWSIVQEREFREVWGRQRLRDSLRTHLERTAEEEGRANAMVRFQQYHLLRIMLGDLAGALRLESITSELSDLADVLVHSAFENACESMVAKYGELPGSFTIFALGKMGARELNYSSDIDLIFIYKPDENYKSQDLDLHEYMVRVGKRTIKLLDDTHTRGRMYRVDMRLRPEGNSGELALSFRETRDYCYSVGRPWERQAWIKARSIAGDIALGQRLIDELRPWIFPQSTAWEDLEDARVMRRRIEERGEVTDLKVGAGGIRDIEFLVQYYQLLYGGRYPALRHRQTLVVLDQLVDRGVMSGDDRDTLHDAYVWLRMVEHRLQMWDARQLHALPENDSERNRLAYRCGYSGGTALARFELDHEQIRGQVRALSDRYYLSGSTDKDALFALVGDDVPDPVLVQRVMGHVGFRDPLRAAKRIRALGRERFFVLSRGRTERYLVELLPTILDLLTVVPDPDATLENLEHIIDAVGGRAHLYRMLIERPLQLNLFVGLAGWADYPVGLLTRFHGLADEILERRLRGQPTLDELMHDLTEMTRGVSAYQGQIGFIHAREMVVASMALLGGLGDVQVGHWLTDTAEAILRTLVERATADHAEKWGLPSHDGKPMRFAVIGCGKMGSGEFSFASDMDILFVCDDRGTCADGHDGDQFWNRVVRRVVRDSMEHHLYEIDARLRPWGDQGEMVVSMGSLAKYWQGDRELWERLAMTRIRPVAGDPDLGQEACDLIRAAAIGKDVPQGAAEEVVAMRGRLESSVSGRDHLKRGPGGYVDPEFVAQYLVLGRDPALIPLGADVPTLLAIAAQQGWVDADVAETLTQGLQVLRRMENRARLYEGKAVSSIPNDEVERNRFAKAVGFPSRQAMDLELHVARERNRGGYNHVFGLEGP